MRGWMIAALALAVATSAAAQSQAASLAGAWTYRTDVWTTGRCVISGDAMLTPIAGRADQYRAHLVSTEACDYGGGAVAEQECVVLQDGQTVLVQCRVTRTNSSAGYLPDDFVLQMRTHDHLVGRLTANWNAPAEWRRRSSPAIS